MIAQIQVDSLIDSFPIRLSYIGPRDSMDISLVLYAVEAGQAEGLFLFLILARIALQDILNEWVQCQLARYVQLVTNLPIVINSIIF